MAGAVTLDRTAGRGEVSLRVPTAGVYSGLAVFNARLRQADLLASTEYPEVTSWRATSASRAAAWRGAW